MFPDEEKEPNGIIYCPCCNLSSLSWNIICARCGNDLFPDEHAAAPVAQENAA